MLVVSIALFIKDRLTPAGINYNQTDQDGKPHGPWVEYDEDSITFTVLTYEHGEKSGPEVRYYPDSTRYFEMNWQYDANGSYLEGPFWHYYEDGSPYMESYYKNGIPDSLIRFFFRDGVLQLEGAYAEGLKVGKWTLYDEIGSRVKVIDYTDAPQPWNSDLRHGAITYYVAGMQPVLKATWYYDQLINDTILDEEGFRQLQQTGIIDSNLYNIQP
jgi:antitoxin component YwqK of YwqJK toxin-antitoxin module